jgi:hypothetical protein
MVYQRFLVTLFLGLSTIRTRPKLDNLRLSLTILLAHVSLRYNNYLPILEQYMAMPVHPAL